MRILILTLTLVLVSGCGVLNRKEAGVLYKTLELQKQGWEKLEKGEKAINTFILKQQCDQAQKLIKEALDD